MKLGQPNRRHIAWAMAAACGLLAANAPRVGMASEKPAGGHGEAAAEEAPVDPNSPIRGISLGEFQIRAYYPVEARRSTVIFIMHAIVTKENADEFKHLLEYRRHKVRDQVIVATRLAPLAEFDDPQLVEFRRRVLVRLRRTVPELHIDDLYISDFTLEVRGI